MTEPPLGPKLQMLVNAGCITESAAYDLSQQRRTAIEQLTYTQIGTLIDTHELVGDVGTANLI